MFSLFRKKVAAPAELTFKQRVEAFWSWYASVAERFYQTIEDGNCATLVEEVEANIDQHLTRFAWVFGPGADGKGHSFTLSADGNPHRQLLTQYWVNRAPTLPGWTFHPARQPGSLHSIVLDASQEKFNPQEFWLTPYVDDQDERIDLTVWHPLFDRMPEERRWFILYLFLDEALGEYGTGQWIGEIKINNRRLAQSMPLGELPDLTKSLQADKGWKKLPPGETYCTYKNSDQQEDRARGDIIAGSTVHFPLIRDFGRARDEFSDPLAGKGADFVYVCFPKDHLNEGKQVDERAVIEEALERELKTDFQGRCLGGALGTRNAYIDLLLFDGASSIKIVRDVLRQQRLPAGTSINYFAKEKTVRRVEI